MEHIKYLLPWSASGTERHLSLFRFGQGTRKAYIQASLHADELPGMLVIWHLKQRMLELEQAGLLRKHIVLVPVANASDAPIKLIGVGEGIDDLQPFDARAFSRSLVGLED